MAATPRVLFREPTTVDPRGNYHDARHTLFHARTVGGRHFWTAGHAFPGNVESIEARDYTSAMDGQFNSAEKRHPALERMSREEQLGDRLSVIEEQLDELAATAWAQGMAVRISCPTGEVVPAFFNPSVKKDAPAFRLVRYRP